MKPADNQTTTQFKSRSIVIPSQSIVSHQDPSMGSEPTNQKNQTLKDLCSLLKHYNYRHRKDALLDIQELLSDHAYLMQYHSSLVLESAIPLVLDEELEVRKSLHTFFEFLFSQIPLESMKPFSSMMMAYISSALSHINESIRISGFRFLDLFSTFYKSLIPTFGQKIMSHCLSLLTMNSNGMIFIF